MKIISKIPIKINSKISKINIKKREWASKIISIYERFQEFEQCVNRLDKVELNKSKSLLEARIRLREDVCMKECTRIAEKNIAIKEANKCYKKFEEDYKTIKVQYKSLEADLKLTKCILISTEHNLNLTKC